MKYLNVLLLVFGIVACTNCPVSAGLSARYTVEPVVQNLMMIRGVPAEPDEWPASVYARVDQTGTCSATLVGERVVLIAAHCVPENGKISFAARANNYNATCNQHPEYMGATRNETADFALCLITRPVTGVLFESVATKQPLRIGEEVVLSGYGCTQPGGTGGNDGIFRIGKAVIDGLPTLTDFDVVTRGGAALCFGDSGGAAYVVDRDKRVIFGVNSRGNIDTVSYLPSVMMPQFMSWAKAWSLSSNNVKICGLSPTALYCRNNGINQPIVNAPVKKYIGPKVIKRRRGGRV